MGRNNKKKKRRRGGNPEKMGNISTLFITNPATTIQTYGYTAEHKTGSSRHYIPRLPTFCTVSFLQ
jgi:hypothetical protein